MITYKTADEAVSIIKSNERVYIHGGTAFPQCLVDALVRRNNELENVEIVHILTEGVAGYARPEYSKSFWVNNFFVGGNVRKYVDHVNVQYIPVFLSEIPGLFRKGILPLDTALIHVSVPDNHGFCSLGVSVDMSKAATEVAQKIIALVNPNMPRTHGDSQIHCSRFAAAVLTDDEIPEVETSAPTKTETAIGQHVASLIEDRSTLQMGIGGIPNAVLSCLGNHKDLGIHTELFSNGILPLVEKGVITGQYKKKHKGKIVSTIAMGNKQLYTFMHDNPMVSMLEASYVNDTSVIRQNDKVIAINSAIEIDLSGQVCADSIGADIFSGVGGQMDFMRGAAISPGGKPIIAMKSRTEKGLPKIVATLREGAGVVTTRAHVHYVVTEFGIAQLHGKTLNERAHALIQIAHPGDREPLEKTWFEVCQKFGAKPV